MNKLVQINCKNCGLPVGFDIINQTYRCPACGQTTGIEERREDVLKWQQLQSDNDAGEGDAQKLRNSNAYLEYECPDCGALIVFEEGDASEKCDFCGSSLIRIELSLEESRPDLIIPFFITPEEARERMLDWGKRHSDTPEGRKIVSNMGKFKGYYLPYRLTRGPVHGQVLRDGSKREYRCGGYLEGTAVNTSKQLDNAVLNRMEPFDWSAARPFETGYIAGQPVKLNDLSDEEIKKRILMEAEEDFLPEVEKVMETTGVKVKVESEELEVISVLLPVYFIKSGKFTAVMNGQTGRIAVSAGRKKETKPWVIEPLAYTVAATLLMSIPAHFEVVPMFLFAFVFACIFFSIMGEGRHSLIRRITLSSSSAKARREDGELRIDEGNDILKNPYDNTPVFYEKNKSGKYVPVKIKFYGIKRIISMIVKTSLFVFLPLVIAAVVHYIDVTGTTEAFSDYFRPAYGGAWYVLAGMVAVIYFAKGIRRDVYEHPILYEILPSGKKKLMGTRKSRKISMFASWGVGVIDDRGKRVTLFRAMRDLGWPGIFIGVVFIVIFIVSISAIIS